MTNVYDSEAAIIGGLLLFPKECSNALEILTPKDFASPLAAQAFQIIVAAYKSEKKLDSAIFQSGEATKEVKNFALSAAQAFLSTSNYDAYISTVLNNSGKRRVTKQIQELVMDSYSFSGIMDRLSQILAQENSGVPKGDEDFILNYISGLDHPLDPTSRIDTGFSRLDRAIGGLRKGSLCYIGAYPSTGKTAFACNIMGKNLREQKRVQFFSLEMSREQILDRLFSDMLEFDYNKLDEKRLSAEEQVQIVNAAKLIVKNNDLSIEDQVYSVEAIAWKMARYKPDLVIIDFLQNIRTAEKFQIRKNQIDYISAELKRLARDNNCVVITLSQLSRSSEKPTMTSLKESGNLEADGDCIMLIYRPYVTNKSGKYTPEQAEVLLDKNKFGICGKVEMSFCGQYQRFIELKTKHASFSA